MKLLKQKKGEFKGLSVPNGLSLHFYESLDTKQPKMVDTYQISNDNVFDSFIELISVVPEKKLNHNKTIKKRSSNGKTKKHL